MLQRREHERAERLEQLIADQGRIVRDCRAHLVVIADQGDRAAVFRGAGASDAALMGFSNIWQAAGLPSAVTLGLPSGTRIRALSPPYLVATKLEAFRGRGGGYYLGSRDLEDVVFLVDGREELAAGVAAVPWTLREFLAAEISDLLRRPAFTDALFGFQVPTWPAKHGRTPSSSPGCESSPRTRSRRLVTGTTAHGPVVVRIFPEPRGCVA